MGHSDSDLLNLYQEVAPAEEFRRLQVVEEEERETLRRIARNFYAPGGKPEGDRLE